MKSAGEIWDKVLTSMMLKSLVMGFTTEPSAEVPELTPKQRAHRKVRNKMQRESRRRNRANWY